MNLLNYKILSLLRKVIFRHCDREERSGKQSQHAYYPLYEIASYLPMTDFCNILAFNPIHF